MNTKVYTDIGKPVLVDFKTIIGLCLFICRIPYIFTYYNMDASPMAS